MNQLTPEQLARIEENRQRALDRKRKFEESQVSTATSPAARQQHQGKFLQPTNLSRLNSNSLLPPARPHEEKGVFPIFRTLPTQGTPPTVGKASLSNSSPPHGNASGTTLSDPISAGTPVEKQVTSHESVQPGADPPAPLLGDAKLSDEQAQVLSQIMAGKNVFITGCGGTGKSHLMHHAIKAMRELRGKGAVAVTATTGIAACHIGGTSLHTFAGIGLGTGKVQDLVKKVRGNRSSTSRWLRTQALVVDEISMLDAELFDKLEELAREIKGDRRPFGGVQVILVGDFLQLPPVGKNGQEVKFCFDSRSWRRVVQLHVELKHVFRQSNMAFVNMLNEVRWGRCSDAIAGALTETMRHNLNDGSGLKATRLYAKNMQVDEINARSLQELPGPRKNFLAQDGGDQPFLDQLRKNCLAPEKLDLKIGAQVMLLKNLDPERNLINGSRGVVKAFQMNEDPDNGELGEWPVVRFETVKGDQEMVLTNEEFTIEGQGKVLAKRRQVPLRLAYAITIHKCQGMTLSRVEMSLRDVFEPGQAYVALSRVSSLEGLKLIDFAPKAVRAHPRVVQFYREMNSPTQQMEAEKAEGKRVNPLLFDDE